MQRTTKYVLLAIFALGFFLADCFSQPQNKSFYLKDGTTIQGKIIAQDDSLIVVETPYGILEIQMTSVIKQEIALSNESEATTFFIKDGTIIKGVVITESEDSLSIETSYGLMNIPKSSVKNKKGESQPKKKNELKVGNNNKTQPLSAKTKGTEFQTITMKDGTTIKGVVVSESDDSLGIETDYETINIPKSDISESHIEVEQYKPDEGYNSVKANSIGLGFGIPYGILGMNFDLNIVPNLNLSGGIGSTIIAGVGYNFGLKYFFSGLGPGFRPKISVFYGTNSVLEVSSFSFYSSFSSVKMYAGLSIGIGSQTMWGNGSHGIDFDVIVIVTNGELDEDFEKLEEAGGIGTKPNRIKISLGYRFAF